VKSIHLNYDQFLEFEKIAIGAFSPLDGFMDEKNFNSVKDHLRLSSGELFTIPIILDVDKFCATDLIGESKVEVFYKNSLVGYMFPTSFYTCDRNEVSRKVFGTSDLNHPGVLNFFSLKEIFVGGKIEKLENNFSLVFPKELTPKEQKREFENKKWKTIAGFQTRNIPHKAHEYLLRVAIEISDGLFVQPIIGKKQSGDFTPAAILRGYEVLIKNYLPAGRVVLGTLSTQMRYAGPREALFHAIIRKNYGCTHFIIGRDHAGVGNWYDKYAAQEFALKYETEIGIKILALKGPYYCTKCDTVTTENSCSHENTIHAVHISGSDVRQILKSKKVPNNKLIRIEIIKALEQVKCFID
jgi:sulfate adenylyltransferase